MPKRLEEALKRRAAQLGYEKGSDRYNRYIYGGMQAVEKAKSGKSDRGRDCDK